MIKSNFEERISELKNLLNIWEQRNLTLKGKITILKAKALPLITYISTFIYVRKHMARASIRRATPFFSVTGTQHQITKAAESNLVTINRVLMCF